VFLVDPVHSYLCDGSMIESEGFEKYRKQLEESLVEIEQYLAKTEESAEAVSPDKSLGRLSRMEAMQDQQLMLEARRRKKMQKVAVQSALQRIENGQFGTCIFCGNLIPDDRLEVAPESSSCVNCSAFS
jgi:DnaK suppressor protein